jgi:hypothetical protein
MALEDTEKTAIINSNDGSIASELQAVDARALFKKRLYLKLNLYILIPMLFLNVLSLISRTNIGAALIQELPADLHLIAMKVFLATTMPLIISILLKVPSNLLMK